ncbi:MAG: hypothetical protein WC797_01190 [Candidatus Paceibacterota bacterium]|jgi:hypothetical protein
MTKAKLLSYLLVGFLSLPYVAAAAIVPCTDSCTFKELGALVKNLIDFFTLKVAAPIGLISVTISGILYVMAAGDPGQANKAKEILWYSVGGLALAFGAQLLINTILDLFASEGSGLVNKAL